MITNRDRNTFLDGFFDGFGPVGLFSRVERPDAPSNVFSEEGDELEAGDSINKPIHDSKAGQNLG
jgi:hypothetical protein